MKITKERLERAARLFLADSAPESVSGKIEEEKLPSVTLYKSYGHETADGGQLHVFLNEGGSGMVVLSDNDELEPVWAQSDVEGNPEDAGECPPFDAMMEGFLREIDQTLERLSAAKANEELQNSDILRASENNRRKWESIFAGQYTLKTSISPAQDAVTGENYLITTCWKQTGYYSEKLCHFLNGYEPKKNEPWKVGCGAVAVAQLLHYYGAKYGNNKIKFIQDVSYTWEKYGKKYTLTGPRDHRTYQPSKMLDILWPLSSKDETQSFLRDVALLVQSNFGTKSTGSYTHNVEHLFNNVLNGGSCRSLDSSSKDMWKNIVESIESDRPVYVAGFSQSGRHAFIIDGHYFDKSDTEYYHYNMGWGKWWYSILWAKECDYTVDQSLTHIQIAE